MPNPVMHWELNTKDGAAAQKFYSDVFGWKIDVQDQETTGGYGLVDTGGEGINGGIGNAQGEPEVVFYIQVDDPAAYLKKIEERGGKTLMEPTEIPGIVTFARFADPQGNVVGLIEG